MSSTNVNVSDTKNSEVTSSSKLNNDRPSESDKTCVVCFKIVDIFSIGECDHPVCYECSTRMRVLCKQNECPICRRINQKVIFTSEILPYKELELKNRSCLYDKQYRICFTGQRAQNAFRRLLEHSCNKCNEPPFETAAVLKDHLRRKHELFYCDLCMEHLKIFSFERRAYTREQLAMHRRKGDSDNTSHRGHPLCEYCDQRYLDRDELFRHLRKEHYYCHFCDADGSNHFYANHNTLQAHFLDQHFLCMEGECKENIFSAVYRTDIDLKAHKAAAHGQTSKQARTIEFQFNLAPRNNRAQQNQENELVNGMNHVSGHYSQPTMTQQRLIDAKNEQEFPSLGNAPVTVRPTIALNMGMSTSGLARTKENFPALGGGNSHNKDPFRQLGSIPAANASTLLFKTQAPKHAATSSTNNKNISNNKTKTVPNKANDFPALSGKGKKAQLESDMIESSSSFDLGAVSAKHRQLINSYEGSVANALLNLKMKTIQRAEIKPATSVNNPIPLINSKDNFPALGGPITSAAAPQWLNATTNGNKKQTQMSKKLKIAPAPILPTSKFTDVQNEMANKKGKSNDKTKAVSSNDKKTENAKAENSNQKSEKNSKKSDKENAKKTKENSSTNPLNENQTKSEKKINSLPIANTNAHNTNNNHNKVLNETINSYSSVANFTMPPPGFPAQKSNDKSTKAPPGFEYISKTSKQYSYISPSNALFRNQILMSHFIKSLKPPAVDEFRNISKMFRSGACNARAYYEHCEIVLGERFESIFPEVLALLPDIGKQQELYRTYREKHNQSKSCELNNSIQVCTVCQQVVKRSDFVEHTKYHNEIENDNKLNKNFPKLSIKK